MPISDLHMTVPGGSHDIPMTTKMPSFILISCDTIHLGLKEFESACSKKAAFASAISVALSAIPVVLTSSGFNDFLGVPGAVWHAVYVLLAFGGVAASLGYLGYIAWNWKKLTTDHALAQICADGRIEGRVTIDTNPTRQAETVPLNFDRSTDK